MLWEPKYFGSFFFPEDLLGQDTFDMYVYRAESWQRDVSKDSMDHEKKYFLLFSPIFTEGNKAKLIEVESESDIFPEDEEQSWQIWIDHA